MHLREEQRPGGVAGEPRELDRGRHLAQQRQAHPDGGAVDAGLPREAPAELEHGGARGRHAVTPGRLVEDRPGAGAVGLLGDGERVRELVFGEGNRIVERAELGRAQGARRLGPLGRREADLGVGVGAQGDAA